MKFLAHFFVLMAMLSTHAAQCAEVTSLREACQNHFYVGVAINRTTATGIPIKHRNFKRNSDQIKQDTLLVKSQFNQIVAENDMKWQVIHPKEGPDGYDFGPADAFVNFGLSNHMYLVGHTLVWHLQTPFWVFRGTNPPTKIMDESEIAKNNPVTNQADIRSFDKFGHGNFSGFRASREQLLQCMHDHIFKVVGRYRGKIKVWDVVNEAISDDGTNLFRDSLWFEIIGPDYVAKAFQYAHEADPNAILRYNDFGLEDTSKRRKLITLIKSLQEQHVPVIAIGSQTHVSISSPSFEEEDEMLTELESLGLPIHITELDVNCAQSGQNTINGNVSANALTTQGGLVHNADQKLSDAYARLFRAFLKHEHSVKIITFWGINDGVSWKAQGHPLLFDANNHPKPAFNAVIETVTAKQ